jgi:hypothetical protein
VLIVNNAPWHRTWVNRAVYVHPFVAVPRYAVAPRPAEHREEHHEVRQRTAHEREAARNGRASHEEHRR